MAQITKTVRQLLEQQQRRNLSRELSECVRAVDLADRKTGVGRKLAVRLATLTVGLARVDRHLDVARQAAEHGDSHARFLVDEHAALSAERDRLLRKFLTGEYSDSRLTTLGLERWAQAVLAEEKARKAATGRHQ